ncbi:MAG: SpoIIE family protein phosphatase [Terracidiphilus sp.]
MLARLSRFRCVPIVLLVALTAFNSNAEEIPAPSPTVINGLGKGAVPLAGPWSFHLGDDPAWASPSLDDSHWELLSPDRPWGVQGHARYTGSAWYRLHLTIRPASDAFLRFSLLVPLVEDVYEVYWNGQRVGRNGKFPPYPVWFVSQKPQIVELGPGDSGVLAFRVWKAPLFSDDPGEVGGFAQAPLIGDNQAIAAAKAVVDYEWLKSRQFLFGEHLIYGLIALLSLLMWWRNRKQWALLWMVGFSLAPLANVLLLNAHIPWPYALAMGLVQPINSIQDISLWLLLLWLLHLNTDPGVFRLVKILAAVDFTITSLDGLLLAISWHPRWLVWAQSTDAMITIISTLIQLLPLVLVGFAVSRWRRLKFASWMVVLFAFLDEMIVVVGGALKQGQRFTGWTIGDEILSPLFTVNGNAISLGMITRALLLVFIVYAVYNNYRKERQRQMVMANEFSNARELQRILVPETQHATPGFEVSSSYRPAMAVGGDFFQLIPLDGDPAGAALLIVGDVSGHGLKAALSVSYIVGVMRVLAEIFPQPAQLLAEINRRLCGRLQNGFATCIALRIDRLGRCTIASAGHPPPFLNRLELDVPGALPLGIDDSTVYEQSTVQLHPGDHLALYTDGLLEARSKTGELYGFERLEQLFARNPTAEEAAEAAVAFGQDDDITIVTLTCVADRQTGFEDAFVGSTLARPA